MTILTRLKQYCLKANRGEAAMSEEYIEYFGELCKTAMRKQFQEKEQKFKLRMSQIGKDVREQQGELLGLPKDEEAEYNLVIKFLYGDVTEAILMTLLKASGVQIEDEQKAVTLDIAGVKLEGTYDIKINGKIYDIKSCSPYAFTSKFGGGFDTVDKTDTFGYVTQLYLYAEAEQESRVGGWLVINKVDGQLLLVEAPTADEVYKKRHIALAERNINKLLLTKSIDDIDKTLDFEAETFYSKPTGRYTMPKALQYFSFKKALWGDKLEYKANPSSKAQNPEYKYYKK